MELSLSSTPPAARPSCAARRQTHGLAVMSRSWRVGGKVSAAEPGLQRHDVVDVALGLGQHADAAHRAHALVVAGGGQSGIAVGLLEHLAEVEDAGADVVDRRSRVKL